MAHSKLLFAAAAMLLTAAMASSATAAAYPDRPIRFLVGFTPGGGTDILARLFADRLSAQLKQPVVVVNKAGANGVIAGVEVANARPDGYTILLITPNHTTTASLIKLDYDPIKDFSPIIKIATEANVLVINPASVPSNNLADFIAFAKTKPGQLNFGSQGRSGPAYRGVAELMRKTGINLVAIDYKGTPEAVFAVLRNEVQLLIASSSGLLPHINSGAVKALGVTTSTRTPLLPNVPTIKEAAKLDEYDVGVWYGVLAPANTPKDIVTTLNQSFAAVLRQPDIQQNMISHGYISVGDTPEQFGAFIIQDLAALLKAAALEADKK